MTLSLIAAIGKNNELGKAGTLLWNIPEDMKHFKTITTGHTIIMGRKTFESIGKPLPNRKNIVITRDINYWYDGIEIAGSLDEALRIASLEHGKGFEENQDEVEVFIIGGSQIYTEAINRVQKLYITHIDAEAEADAFFPEIDLTLWKEIKREHHESITEPKIRYDFTEYIKI